ncbi:aspartyl/asparaginyl beta-hydroxylase domain-containing protein [Flavobacterium sp.]|uniref:aspartyl/asparaginyl beta-hydroxylase domain-containing protein n=1 Tax=Flavobacterium sp. TaxID=239 RepID=UPI00286D855F|nr:aspartyl/asparaginyl beta-hydroxylase domain-containing protein [Flavobacterium sp.]
MMSELIRSIKFPLVFDTKRLKQDVENVMSQKWINHYNTNDYKGDWSSIALMSQGGKSDNIYALNTGNSEVLYTDVLLSCDYFKEILERFQFKKTSVRLLRLSVGAEIKPHKDHCLGYEDGCFRMHIPIITNSEVLFILDNKRLIMNEGECWYIDANFTHSVSNHGKEDRIHLVIDGIRNEWTDALFFQQATENEFVRPIPKMSSEQKELMIQELKRMNTPTANQIIDDLLKE